MIAATFAAPSESAPWDAVADIYDETFTASVIGKFQRRAVWREIDRAFSAGQKILELNCGTGVDAARLAGRGIEVWACDQSSRMLEVARRRIKSHKLDASVRLCRLANEEISTLEGCEPFDGAFSNFGGLNCVRDTGKLAQDLARLLKPGARAVFCVMGRHVAWEIAWFSCRGKFRTAFRRFGRGPIRARLGTGTVACWYPSVRVLHRAFGPHFRLVGWRGVGVAIPPTYLESTARRFPRVIEALARVDRWLGKTPGARGLGDHWVLTFEKRACERDSA
jgi:ubiquinone/menaquinone biosynthesis C-methylase UbiE